MQERETASGWIVLCLLSHCCLDVLRSPYSGTPDVRELDNGASLTLNLCLCIDTQQSSTSYYVSLYTLLEVSAKDVMHRRVPEKRRYDS